MRNTGGEKKQTNKQTNKREISLTQIIIRCVAKSYFTECNFSYYTVSLLLSTTSNTLFYVLVLDPKMLKYWTLKTVLSNVKGVLHDTFGHFYFGT